MAVSPFQFLLILLISLIIIISKIRFVNKKTRGRNIFKFPNNPCLLQGQPRELPLKQKRNEPFGPLHIRAIGVAEVLQALGLIALGREEQEKRG